jgi:hypothetical protein
LPRRGLARRTRVGRSGGQAPRPSFPPPSNRRGDASFSLHRRALDTRSPLRSVGRFTVSPPHSTRRASPFSPHEEHKNPASSDLSPSRHCHCPSPVFSQRLHNSFSRASSSRSVQWRVSKGPCHPSPILFSSYSSRSPSLSPSILLHLQSAILIIQMPHSLPATKHTLCS